MAWNFRRRIKLIPGVHLNFSKNGISTSIGFRGASVTLSKQGPNINTGIPGTGIYSRQKLSSGQSNQPDTFVPQTVETVDSVDNIISVDVEEVTSQNMQGIKNAIISANKQRQELSQDIAKVNSEKKITTIKLVLSYIFLIGLIIKNIRNNILADIETQKKTISELEKQHDNSYVNLDVEFDEEIKSKYDKVVSSFRELSASEKIWDVTTATIEDRVATRSSASISEKKTEVIFSFKSLEDIKSKHSILFLSNSNGADLYFYPNFIVMHSAKGNFGIIDFKELDFNFNATRFVETEGVPSDSKIIDKTWAKVNKDGSPDKRFKGNYEIPVVRYGTIHLRTQTGLNEEYEFSNYEACAKFAHDFSDYQATINSLKQA